MAPRAPKGPSMVREAFPSDIPGIERLWERQSPEVKQAFGRFSVVTLLEDATLSLVATSDGRVIGFAALTSTLQPLADANKSLAETLGGVEWAEREAAALGYLPMRTLWLKLVITLNADASSEDATARALLHATFARAPEKNDIVAIATSPIQRSLLSLVSRSPEWGIVLQQCHRSLLLPQLRVRDARVEDCDDLAPVMDAGFRACPPLATLPAATLPERQFALARAIQQADKENVVLVGEAAGRLVGLMSLHAEVDPQLLQEHFELETYDGLIKITPEREAEERQKKELAEKAKELRRQKRAERAEARAAAAAAAAAEASEGDQAGTLDTMDPGIEEDYVDEEEEDEAAALGGRPKLIFGPCNAVDLAMVCLFDEFDSRGSDFLHLAFEKFPDRDYVVALLPHDAPRPGALRGFTKVPLRPLTTFSQVLYIFHRQALSTELAVHRATGVHLAGIQWLVEGFPNEAALVASVQEIVSPAARTPHASGAAVPHMPSHKSVYVLECEGIVVAFLILAHAPPWGAITRHFALDAYLNASSVADESRFAMLDAVVINPIFATRYRSLFFEEVLRQEKKDALLLAAMPQDPVPEGLETMYLVPGRQLPGVTDPNACRFALYLVARKLLLRHKADVNARVLVLGDSDAGAAFIERLVLCPRLNFTNVTVISNQHRERVFPPHIPDAGMDMYTYSTLAHAKMGLDARVRRICAQLVAIDRENKVVFLADESPMPYEHLVLTPGLQDATLALGGLSADMHLRNFTTLEQLQAKPLEPKPASSLAHVVVYGASLDALAAAQLLLAMGTRGNAITLVLPPVGDRQVDMAVVLGDTATEARLMSGVMAAGVNVERDMRLLEVLLDKSGEAVSGLVMEHLVRDDARTVVKVEAAEQPCDLLVGCASKQVDPALFRALQDASIVYDGRLVVDNQFHTNAPNIYAAGTVTKFSRRCHSKLLMSHTNSLESGYMLADAFLSRYTQGGPPPPPGDLPPTFTLAKAVGASLPGGWRYLHAATPEFLARTNMPLPPEGGDCFTTEVGLGNEYMRLDRDKHGTLVSALLVWNAAELGNATRPHMDGWKLGAIVGLHISYLNQLVEKFTNESITDLRSFLNEPWAAALYHDKFHQFREDLESAMQKKRSQGTKFMGRTSRYALMCMELCSFLKGNESELPGYQLPIES